MDVFHGVNHRISVALRDYIREIAPYMHTMANSTADNPGFTADLIGRVFFDIQQDYFGWLALARNNPTTEVPSFQQQIKLIKSHRASALPSMPTLWYSMFKEIQPADEKKPTSAGPARSGSQSTVNSHADTGLINRFKDSGHTAISAMTKDKDFTVPKVSGTDVCLSWALKGQCTTTCKRKACSREVQRQHGQEDPRDPRRVWCRSGSALSELTGSPAKQRPIRVVWCTSISTSETVRA